MVDFTQNPLVTTEWLAAHLEEPGLRIVDARWRGERPARELYQEAHLPGAVHLDWHEHLSHTVEGVRDRLLPPEAFAAVMGAAGIGDETRVVAYAETDYSGAARVWWALRYYGHDQVAVMDGGIGKWREEGRPLEAGTVTPVPANFTPRPRPEWLATIDEIQRVVDSRDPNSVLVDTRPREQYVGQAVWTPLGSRFREPGQALVDAGGRAPMRTGHIPGAVHLHASTNFDPETWTYLPPEALRQQAEAAGARPEQRVITYCGVGISASAGLFALYLAGYRNLALYDGSWEEWGTDPNRPIATGE